MSTPNYKAQIEGKAYQSANSYSVWCQDKTMYSIRTYKAYADREISLTIEGY